MLCYHKQVSEGYFLYWFWEVTTIKSMEIEQESWN